MKWILRILLLLIVVVVGGGLGAFFFTPSSVIAGQAAKAVRESTGREFVMEGEIERTLYPVLGIRTGPIRLANADWAEEPVMIAAREAVFSVKTFSLFGEQIEVEQIKLVDPVIHLEVDESGRRSWDFPTGAEPKDFGPDTGGDAGSSGGGPGERDEAPGFALIAGDIENGTLTFTDRQNGQVLKAEQINLKTALPSLDATLTADGSAVINGETATLTLALDSPAALRKGEKTLADLKLTAPGVNLAFDGAIQPPAGGAPKADGTLAFALDADKETTAWLRSALPPDMADLGGVTLDGTFRAEETSLDVDMTGEALYRGQQTSLALKATAGEGWMEARTPADVDLSLKNALMDVGYAGVIGGDANGAPVARGAYRARIPNVSALVSWTGQPAPAADDPLAKLSSINLSGDLDIDASQAVGTLSGGVGYGGRDVAVSGQIEGGADWMNGGAIRSDLTADSAGLFSAGWDGTVSMAPAGASADGQARFSSGALRQFAEWVGAGPIAAPKGSFETLDVTTGVTVAPKTASLTGLDLTLDDKKVAGDVTVDQSGPRPSLTAKLVTGALDLRPFTQGSGSAGGSAGGSTGGSGGASGGGGAAASGGRGWSDEPLDLGALKLVDANIDLTTDGLVTNVVRVGKSRLTAILKDGRLETSIPELALYGGGATGTAIVDSNGTPSLDIDMKMSGVQLKPFLQDTSQIDWIEGTGAMAVDIAGSGVSMKRIMKSLNGDASIDFRDGALVGYNLAAIVRNITSLGGGGGEQQKTDFAELGGTFAISNGIARNDDFRMFGPLVRLTGSGTIDIGEQTLNYRAVPKAVATLKGQGGAGDLKGIAFPILITGPWEDPSITPDLAGGALESVEGLLADPEGAASFLKELGGGDAGEVLEKVLGDDAGDAGKLLKDVLGGGGSGADGEKQNPIGGVLDALGGDKKDGGDNPVNKLKGLFGN